jgi:hypothetical protein
MPANFDVVWNCGDRDQMDTAGGERPDDVLARLVCGVMEQLGMEFWDGIFNRNETIWTRKGRLFHWSSPGWAGLCEGTGVFGWRGRRRWSMNVDSGRELRSGVRSHVEIMVTGGSGCCCLSKHEM